MQNRKIITNINRLTAFIEKDIEVPYTVNRAITKNYEALSEEYYIFDKERKRLVKKLNKEIEQLLNGQQENEVSAEVTKKIEELREEYEQKIEDIIETDVEVKIESLNETDIETLKLVPKDRLALEFMIKEA